MDGFEFHNSGGLPPEEAEKLNSLIESLDDRCRKIGLYVDNAWLTQIPGPDGLPRKALVVHYTIGDMAFVPQVQDPEQNAIDNEFQAITANMASDDFLESRERIKRNLAAGRDAFDDGDK